LKLNTGASKTRGLNKISKIG